MVNEKICQPETIHMTSLPTSLNFASVGTVLLFLLDFHILVFLPKSFERFEIYQMDQFRHAVWIDTAVSHRLLLDFLQNHWKLSKIRETKTTKCSTGLIPVLNCFKGHSYRNMLESVSFDVLTSLNQPLTGLWTLNHRPRWWISNRILDSLQHRNSEVSYTIYLTTTRNHQENIRPFTWKKFIFASKFPTKGLEIEIFGFEQKENTAEIVRPYKVLTLLRIFLKPFEVFFFFQRFKWNCKKWNRKRRDLKRKWNRKGPNKSVSMK